MKKLLLILLCVPLMFSCGKLEEISEKQLLDKVRNEEVKKITFVTNADPVFAEIELKDNSSNGPQFKYILSGKIQETEPISIVVNIDGQEK